MTTKRSQKITRRSLKITRKSPKITRKSPEITNNLKKSFLLYYVWVPLKWSKKGVEILVDDPKDLRKTDHIKALMPNQKINFVVGFKEDVENSRVSESATNMQMQQQTTQRRRRELQSRWRLCRRFLRRQVRRQDGQDGDVVQLHSGAPSMPTISSRRLSRRAASEMRSRERVMPARSSCRGQRCR